MDSVVSNAPRVTSEGQGCVYCAGKPSSVNRVESPVSAAEVSGVVRTKSIGVQGRQASWHDAKEYEEAISFHLGTFETVKSIVGCTKWRVC